MFGDGGWTGRRRRRFEMGLGAVGNVLMIYYVHTDCLLHLYGQLELRYDGGAIDAYHVPALRRLSLLQFVVLPPSAMFTGKIRAAKKHSP